MSLLWRVYNDVMLSKQEKGILSYTFEFFLFWFIQYKVITDGFLKMSMTFKQVYKHVTSCGKNTEVMHYCNISPPKKLLPSVIISLHWQDKVTRLLSVSSEIRQLFLIFRCFIFEVYGGMLHLIQYAHLLLLAGLEFAMLCFRHIFVFVIICHDCCNNS